ncbi:site-specific integrase [Mangrovibacterium marinum]|uniref:site-specific integrase n=1 Tax=Mangrovibacterium marinum TaxID=1639118 RepID=UPI002A18A2D3|nr:site-specific integrase [Mangrovibacterium marinum]
MSELENMKINCFIKKTKLLKNGEAPIFIRITFGKERDEFGIKKSVLPECWDSDKQVVKSDCTKASEINNLLDAYRKRIQTYHDVMTLDRQTITARILKEKIIGKKEDKRTILKIFQEHNDNVRKLEDIDFAHGTVERYETVYKHTKEFIRWQYKRDDLSLDELNPQFVKQFELYFKTVRDCSHNTATKYLKNLNKITRIAQANNWISKDPFASYKFKLLPVDAVYLTSKELEIIRSKKISVERISQVRDVFIFCCFTGLAFSDVKTLKKEHVSKDSDGIDWIHKKRKKTNQMSTIYLFDAAKEILRKYENHPEVIKEGMLLPVISNQKMNAYLKEIADLCGIQKSISTHTARHTFATTVTLENNIPLEVVSKSLGHSNTKMTQRYARTTETLIKKNMQKIAKLY